MQRVNERLADRLAQDCRREWKMSRLRSLAGTRASSSDLLRNCCADRTRKAPLGELGCNVSGKLLQDEGSQHGYT